MPADPHLSSDEELARRIADALIAEDLLSIEERDDFRERLMDGAVREQDWIAWLRPGPKEETADAAHHTSQR